MKQPHGLSTFSTFNVCLSLLLVEDIFLHHRQHHQKVFTRNAQSATNCIIDLNMPTKLSGKVVNIIDVNVGHLHEEHNVCNTLFKEDTVVCFWQVQVSVDGMGEKAAVFWMTDEINRCYVDFNIGIKSRILANVMKSLCNSIN